MLYTLRSTTLFSDLSPNTMIDKSTKIKIGNKGDCSVLKPSLMCAVPLVIDRIYKGIHEQIHAKGLFFEKLMNFFYKYKSYYRQVGTSGETFSNQCLICFTPMLTHQVFC